ncbi:MAG: CRISPR system precrRNA processing endoribonuclease RAMP protein Cas6 [Syntrophorhabdaceae bacterium]|nr:CRISPR system precrRNA processing endoribonuclease RAMP protein Cas6 [Syntrophorhabdaceae bacterium]
MEIQYQRFAVEVEAVDPLVLPYYKGSTIRGGFGNVFKRIVCTFKNRECRDCMLSSKCIYAYVFETHPEGDAEIMHMDKYEKIPHPFVIEPPLEKERVFKPGETFSFTLILIGRALDYVPYFIYTFDELGKIGIGKGRGKYSLKSVKNDDSVVYSIEDRTIKPSKKKRIEIPEDPITACEKNDNSDMVKLCTITPLRISHNRRLTSQLEFPILIKNILRRVALLYYFHCEKKTPDWDHISIIKEAERVRIYENRLKWWDWERYSTRQKTRMKMGGLKGEIVYTGNLEPFLPYLKAGEILHTGKGTSFGLGQYFFIYPYHPEESKIGEKA